MENINKIREANSLCGVVILWKICVDWWYELVFLELCLSW